MKRLSILLAVAGLAVIALLLVRFDAASVVSAVLSVGWAGFLLLVLFQLCLFALLGLAWASVVPGVSLWLLIWGRMVRDAATTCLPFSPVGGFVIGARAITLQGLAWTTAAAGTAVDVTAEVLAQLLFSLFGLAALLLLRPGSSLAAPLAIGITAALALALLAVWQRKRIGQGMQALASRLLGDWFQGGIAGMREELARLYASPRRLALGTALHLACWFATGLGTWISLRLLGHHASLPAILALEALLDALVGAAFIVPGAAGVQEAGYVGLGAVFGVPPEVALSVSLLRRSKDLALGLPILALWQWREVRSAVRT